MSISFQVNGRTVLVAANTASQQANVSIRNGQIGDFMVDNTGPNVAILNFGYANTTAATIATTGTPGNGWVVPVGETKYISLNQGHVYNPANTVYVAGITSAGTANVYITPVVIQP